MSYKIALSGNQKSGKSAFSRYLRDNKGFTILDHTGAIKENLAHALAESDPRETPNRREHFVSLLQDIKTKEEYRPLLIEWAKAIGANEGSVLEPLLQIMHDLETLNEERYENIVIDNIRYPAQADIARKYGYQIIRIEGGKYFDIDSERAMDNYEFDLILDASKCELPNYESLLWKMLNLKESKRLYFGSIFADVAVHSNVAQLDYSNMHEGMF